MTFEVKESRPHQAAKKILIVEDDRDLNNLLKFTLEASGHYQVESLFTSTGGLDAILTFGPHLLILDIMLPGDGDGLDLLQKVRASSTLKKTPVILLTARSQEADRIDGFERGADDYISKPFSPKELLLRVQAILRRTDSRTIQEAPSERYQEPEQDTIHKVLRPQSDDMGQVSRSAAEATPPASGDEPCVQVGPLSIYTELYRVFAAGERVPLTATEYQLLLFLAERSGRLQSRGALLQKVWGYEGHLNTRTVDTHIKRLRQKLGAYGSMIETVHGFGYQLIAPAPQSFAEGDSEPVTVREGHQPTETESNL
jgi:two-component system phosphate regulon response regulator PhoB